MRAVLDALLSLLHKIAAPTGTRGSVLLMSGGLIVLGFLFLAFIFRSAIVGDLAPVANARAPLRRALLPPTRPRPLRAIPARPFETAREAFQEPLPSLEKALDAVSQGDIDVRILRSGKGWKVLRVYDCASCAQPGRGTTSCEYERGLLVGAFERVGREVVKVHEIACRARGDPHCEFEVRHGALSGDP